MLLTDLVAPNAILPALKVNSKKQVLAELAAKAAELSGQSERTVLMLSRAFASSYPRSAPSTLSCTVRLAQSSLRCC